MFCIGFLWTSKDFFLPLWTFIPFYGLARGTGPKKNFSQGTARNLNIF
tara:strand:+ start:454 stop:597 length:144 start_codon:yes stop_codon:yes gene_type:complete